MSLVSYLIEYNRYTNILGIGVILGVAWIFSKNKHAINYKLVINALVMQFVLAFCVLRLSAGRAVVNWVATGVNKLYQFADQGSAFLFGNLVDASSPWGFIFAFKVLPIIVFFGALMSLLFHWGIIQRVVFMVCYAVQPLLGTSGAESLCAIANSFLGQTEAPLLVKEYLKDMTRSEMLVVMVSGMATISGAILAVFAAMGVPAEHLLSASVMAIPGSVLIAKLLYPETEQAKTTKECAVAFPKPEGNMFSAISQGTSDGLFLALNVGAMLIAFLSLLALLNALLHAGSGLINTLLVPTGFPRLPLIDLNWLFSSLFKPIAYLMGFTGSQAAAVADLLGLKVTVNELVAYAKMLQMQLPERVVVITTYALCGFSNFSCIGIQIGGIGALVPSKRSWLCELGLYALLGGSLSNLLSAMIAGLLL